MNKNVCKYSFLILTHRNCTQSKSINIYSKRHIIYILLLLFLVIFKIMHHSILHILMLRFNLVWTVCLSLSFRIDT